MATGIVKVTVVDVGQGQCTFVEIYDATVPTKLVHALLFDCGSDKTSDETYANLDFIAAKVLTMTKPGFDCIFFSHSDKDHISLTEYLLDKIAETKKPVIGKIWYGGARNLYKKRDFNILDYIEEQKFCASSEICGLCSNWTDYNANTNKYEYRMWASTDGSVVVQAIAGNVLSDDPDWDDNDEDLPVKVAEALNRVSIVCGLYYGGSSYVICGDATNKTMGAINGHFAGTTVFNKNIMTTMPHHGSRATGLAVAAAYSASFAAIAVVDTFAALMKSHTMTISAYEKHRHPSLELVSKFIPIITTPLLRDPRLKEKNVHRITAYLDIDVGKVKGTFIVPSAAYSFETTTNSFATRYFDGSDTFSYNLGLLSKASKSQGTVKDDDPINEFACWRYDTQTNGDFTLYGLENLSKAAFTGATVKFTSAGVPVVRLHEDHELESTAPEFVSGSAPAPSPAFASKIQEVPAVSVRMKRKPQRSVHAASARAPFSNQLRQFH